VRVYVVDATRASPGSAETAIVLGPGTPHGDEPRDSACLSHVSCFSWALLCQVRTEHEFARPSAERGGRRRLAPGSWSSGPQRNDFSIWGATAGVKNGGRRELPL